MSQMWCNILVQEMSGSDIIPNQTGSARRQMAWDHRDRPGGMAVAACGARERVATPAVQRPHPQPCGRQPFADQFPALTFPMPPSSSVRALSVQRVSLLPASKKPAQ